MLLSRHSFYAMGSDCAVHLFADSAAEFERFALAAEAEAVRIERRYSRCRSDSELSRINAVAARGGSVSIDDETAALEEYQ
jgi:FAD:protein FMN transferase